MRPSRAPVAGLCIAAGRLSGCSGTASPTAPDNSNSVRLAISRASLIFSPNRFGEVLWTGVGRAGFSDFALNIFIVYSPAGLLLSSHAGAASCPNSVFGASGYFVVT